MFSELIDGDGGSTGPSLHASAARLAVRLHATGVRPGEVLAAPVAAPRELVRLRLALAQLDAALLPLPTGGSQLPLADWGVAWHQGDPDSRPRRLPGAAPYPDAVRLLLATSGSTGMSRAVLLTDAALQASAERVNARLDLNAGDTWLACLPLYHMGGQAILERCRLAGAAVWLLPRFDPAAVARALASGRVTHLSLVPAMLWRLLEGDISPPRTLRVALLGGQALAPSLAHRALVAGWPLHVSYGASETGGMIASESGPTAGLEAGRVGKLLPDVSVRNEPEEVLAFSGPMVMAGYANAKGWLGAGLGTSGAFCSGDIGGLDAEGALWIEGRSDEVLVSGGVNLHPARVEAQLTGLPGLGEVAVAARPDPVWGDLLVLFYTGTASTEQALAQCRTYLQGAWRPRLAARLELLPLRGPGKLDRRRLAELAAKTFNRKGP